MFESFFSGTENEVMVQLFYINAGNVYEEVSIMYCPHVINHDDDSVNVRSGKFVLSR